jgi:hypothetical protein
MCTRWRVLRTPQRHLECRLRHLSTYLESNEIAKLTRRGFVCEGGGKVGRIHMVFVLGNFKVHFLREHAQGCRLCGTSGAGKDQQALCDSPS